MKNEREIHRLAPEEIALTLTDKQKEVLLDALKFSREVIEKTPDSTMAKYHRGFVNFWGFLEDEKIKEEKI